TAHARPSCAATANRRHCAFDNAASTATTPIVVFNRLSAVPVPAEGNSPGRRGQRVTPNSPPCSYSAAYGSPVSGRTTSPAAFTTASAPTTKPSTCSLAEPTPPFSEPACAPAPAPAVPWATEPSVAASHAAYPNAAPGRRPHSPRGRSQMTAAGTIGTTCDGSAPTGNPRCRSSSQRITPSAAARPNALPPARHTASTVLTRFSGSSRSVSRVPGAPPR